MTVIPFNPGGTGGNVRIPTSLPEGRLPQCRASGTGKEAAPETGRVQAARLEHALIAALRENAVNWARAERAEQMLGERQTTPPGDPD